MSVMAVRLPGSPYVIAVGASLAAVGGAWVLWPLAGASPFMSVLAGIAFAAWRGGAGPGLAATGLGLIGIGGLVGAVERTLPAGPIALALDGALLALIGAAVSALSRSARTTRQRAGADVAVGAAATELDARAAAAGAARGREQLAAAVAHDLRSPLAAIIGQAQFLTRRAGSDDDVPRAQLLRALAAIEDGAQRMDAMVQEFLDAARVRSGQRLRIERRPTDLAALLYEAADDWRRAHGGREIRIAAPPGLVGRWDGRRLRRVFDNLVDNAAKYSPASEEVAVEARSEPLDGRPGVRVAVRDRGVGIPAAELPHLFDWFHRGANAADAAVGSGLGLAGARAIVAAHGGTIAVESCPGLGSTFVVRLPLADDGPGQPSSSAAAAGADQLAPA